MQDRIKEGDRVRLKPQASWNQPYRGWAERGRLGTVEAIFTPHGAVRESFRVRFDRSRKTTRAEVFNGYDLLPVENSDAQG